MTITIGGSIFTVETVRFDRLPEVKRTQQTLLLLISIVFSLYIISFITIIYSLSINYRTHTCEPILILIWILFFASGLFVTQKYYPIGLLVFAWLGIINIILTCILIVFITVGIVIITSQTSEQITEIPFTVLPIVVCLTSVIFDAVIIIYAFKLWYLIIKNQKLSDHQRISTATL